MAETVEKHAETPQTQQQEAASQQQQTSPGSQRQAQFVDPLGRPMYQGYPRFIDQQAGGDLTGDESDARDDNYVVTAGQTARDVSAHATELPAASAELLRSIAVAPVPAKEIPVQIEPDGTEDPGANADDGLSFRKDDGSASERH